MRTGYGPVEEWRDDAIEAWNDRAADLLDRLEGEREKKTLDNMCRKGHREVWYDGNSPCPVCELGHWVEAGRSDQGEGE